MFDRGLIGLSDDLDILVSRQANDPGSIQGLLTFTYDDCTGCQFVCDWCTETDGNWDLRAQLRANSRSGAIS